LHRRNEGAGALAGFKLSPVAIALLAEEEERGLAGCLLEGISSALASPREGLHGKAPASRPPGRKDIPQGQIAQEPGGGGGESPSQKQPKLFHNSFFLFPALSLLSAMPYEEEEMSAPGEGAGVLSRSETGPLHTWTRLNPDSLKQRCATGPAEQGKSSSLSLTSNIFHTKLN